MIKGTEKFDGEFNEHTLASNTVWHVLALCVVYI